MFQQTGKSLDAYLFVPEEPERLSQFITLQERKTKAPVDFSRRYGAPDRKAGGAAGGKTGDTITVQRNDNNAKAQFTVGGVIENLFKLCLSLPTLYQEGYHIAPDFKQTIAVAPDGSQENRDRITSAFLESMRSGGKLYRRYQGFFPEHHQEHRFYRYRTDYLRRPAGLRGTL